MGGGGEWGIAPLFYYSSMALFSFVLPSKATSCRIKVLKCGWCKLRYFVAMKNVHWIGARAVVWQIIPYGHCFSVLFCYFNFGFLILWYNYVRSEISTPP